MELVRKLLIGFCWLPFLGMAQVPIQELEQELESIAEGNEENATDLVQIAENLELLRSNPLAINFVETEELQQIPYLNVFQIANLLRYREATGMIYSPYELMVIKGFDRETIARILPFLDFRTEAKTPALRGKDAWRYSRHNILLRSNFNLQERAGYADDRENGYLGPPQNYYLRYRGTYRDQLSLGFTAQQDAGEPWGKPHQPWGVDFLSGHLALQNYGPLKSLIVGDYQAEFGQGLALWSSLAFNKSAEATEIKRFARGFRPFTGAEENRFFRGAAATYAWGNFTLHGYYSQKRVDANISGIDSLGGPLLTSSLQSTGLHRTESELEDKDANRLRSYGGHLQWRKGQLELGLTHSRFALALPLVASSQLYQAFRFQGQTGQNSSLDFNYLYRDLNLFGELAYDEEGHAALSLGVQSQPADGLMLSLLYRSLDRRYQALYNAPFGESGQYGEQGAYLGLAWQLSRTFRLQSYLDLYRFRWPRFRVNAPSQGREWLSQLEIYLNRKLSAYLRYRSETRQMNISADRRTTKLHPLEWESRRNARFHLDYHLSAQWRLANRVELSFYRQGPQNERGLLIFQDLRYHFSKQPLQFIGRLAFVNSPSFDTRIYAYENDLTYAFSIPAYFGRATRFYLLTNWDPLPRLSLQIKYAVSTFFDRDVISSGLQEVGGNRLSELRLQVRWRI